MIDQLDSYRHRFRGTLLGATGIEFDCMKIPSASPGLHLPWAEMLPHGHHTSDRYFTTS